MTKNKVICPDCQKEIRPEAKLQVGDILECQNCATEVEIVNLSPLQVEIIEEEK